MMSFRTAAVLVALASAIAGIQARATTRYAVVDGASEVAINRSALVEHDLSISTNDHGARMDVADPLQFTIAGTTEIAIDDDFMLIGDALLHDESLTITSKSGSVELTSFTLRVDDRNTFAMTVIDPRTGELLLTAKHLRGAFGASAGKLNAEAGELCITPALAKLLGNESLVGVSIGSLTTRASFVVTQSDGPTPIAAPQPAGGMPRGTAGPDVIVGDLPSTSNYSSVNGIEAFTVGTTSCNIGDTPLQWIDENGSNLHPVIGQNFFRYRQMPDGSSRFEQIGQAWLKHGFCALQGTVCLTCNPYSSGCANHLGVGCSDPYGSSLNGTQSGLGPKFEVNPHTGVFSEPYSQGNQGQFGDSVYKRLQVAISDIDPAIVGPALFFVEGQYVAQDDAAAGNQNNNASYRSIRVTGSGSSWSFSTSGQPAIHREQAGIRAWQDTNGNVVETDAQVPGEGLFIVAAEVTDLGNDSYHYEYAVQNLNSDRAGASFSVPISAGAQVSNVEFHDVNYHSGEPFDGTDWAVSVDAASVTWTSESHASNTNANALRWGTMYNFRFDANASSASGQVTIGLFKPGSPSNVMATVPTPTGGAATTCTGPADGDINNDSLTNGDDIVAFMNALFGTPSSDEICAGDFNNDLVLGTDDIGGFANALIAP